MTQDIGNFALIKNELLMKVVMYYAKLYRGNLKVAAKKTMNFTNPDKMLFDAFNWDNTSQGYWFWNNIYYRLQQDPATELTQSELKTLQPIIDKINEQCK